MRCFVVCLAVNVDARFKVIQTDVHLRRWLTSAANAVNTFIPLHPILSLDSAEVGAKGALASLYYVKYQSVMEDNKLANDTSFSRNFVCKRTGIGQRPHPNP